MREKHKITPAGVEDSIAQIPVPPVPEEDLETQAAMLGQRDAEADAAGTQGETQTGATEEPPPADRGKPVGSGAKVRTRRLPNEEAIARAKKGKGKPEANDCADFLQTLKAQRPAGDGEETLHPVPRKSLADFKRDTEQRNVLIRGRWAVRGGISMHVSSTGSGKSVLQTQSALCFAAGLPCCGLEPVRPFKSWVIQSEDDEDRVAIDRDDVAEYLAGIHPQTDWNAAIRAVRFLDFTGKTGARFIEQLDYELRTDKPDAVIINPFNAYFGGDPNSGKDCGAFLKGGELGRHETEGLEAVLKRHNVWGWIFSHTGKPPTSKELRDWLNDQYSCYKMCGSSAVPDAVRSIVTFLRVPETNTFVFDAGKNGGGLGWTDENGKPTTRAFFKWGENGRHYWQDVPKMDWQGVVASLENRTAKPSAPKPPQPPPRDETPVVLDVFKRFKSVVTKTAAAQAVRDAVNAERRRATPVVKDLSRNDSFDLLDLMAARGVIRILPNGTNGMIGCPCGLPEVVDAWLNPPLLDVPMDMPEAGKKTMHRGA